MSLRKADYATKLEVAGSIPEVTAFFSIELIIPGALWLCDLLSLCLDNVGSLTSHNPIGLPPRPVTGIALLYGDGVCFL
jgi:hypothetical protein